MAGFRQHPNDRSRSRAEFRGHQEFRVENTAVEVDARGGGIAAACSLFRLEGGVPEIVVDVVGTDAMLGDAQLPHAPAGMEFEPVIPVLGELDGMLRWVGRDGFSLGKQTDGLKRRNGRFGRPRMKLRRPPSGRGRDAVEQPSETPSCVHQT